MKQKPAKAVKAQEGQQKPPNTDATPVVQGGNEPVNNQNTPSNTGDSGGQPPGNNDSINNPNGSDGKKYKWKREDTFKTIPIFISLLGLFVSYLAFHNSNKTFTVTQDEYVKLNEAYLEITEPRLVFTDSNTDMTVYYYVENLKAAPAQIIYKTEQDDIDTSNNPNIDSLFNLAESKKDTAYLGSGKNGYLTNGSKPPFFVRFNPTTCRLTRDGYTVLKSTHIFWIYICTIIRYRDVLTGTEREYKGLVRIKNIIAANRFYAEYVYNKNEDAPNQ
jgi:hypothetical protein